MNTISENTESSGIIQKILIIQNNINEIISLKGIFNTGKEKILKKLDTQCNSYYKNKIYIKEIFDSHKPEDPAYYQLVQDPKSILKDTYQSTYDFYFLIRNDNSLMLKLIELSEKSFYEGLSDFFVNYLYENIINISLVEEKLTMMIYLLLEKLILTKLPESIDEENKNVPALYLKDTFLNYVFKDLTRKIDMRNFLYKILRNTILKIDKFRMVLSVDISVVNKFLKISNRFLKKNATTKKEIIQKKKKKFQPIVNKNIFSKNSGNILFTRKRAIALDIKEEDNTLDNMKISDETEKKDKKQFQRRSTVNKNDENNTDNNNAKNEIEENNLTNNGMYNKVVDNINETKADDLDANKFKTSIMPKKKKPKNLSMMKGKDKDSLYSFFEDNSVTIGTFDDRLEKYEKKEKNNINSAMYEYLDNLRTKTINVDINEIDEDELEKKLNKDIKKQNTGIIDENDEYEDNENNMEDEDLFSNSLMIDELKRRGGIQQEETFKFLIEKIKFNYNLITGFVSEIIKNIKDNLIYSPYSLKCISKAIHILLKAKYNNESNNQITPYQLYIFELNFLIGNIILPIIREPDFNGVLSNDFISAFTYENLKIISRILNKMIKGTLFIKSKDPNMTMFNRYIIDTMPKLFELVDIIDQQFDEPNTIKNLVKTSDKLNSPERDINYDYFRENPKENMNYQSICFYSLISFCLNITVSKYKKKFIDENTNDEQKKIIQNFLNNQLAYNLQFSEEKMNNKYKFLYITKILYSKEFNQKLEIMNSNNLITKAPNERNNLLFAIKKCLLETLKIAKKIIKENSYDLSNNNGIDFRKDLLPQIINKILFIINNNTENSINKNIIFFTNYLYLNLSNIPNQYKEKNYILLFEELINETRMIIDSLKSNTIMEYHNKFKIAEKNKKKIEHYASQIKKFKQFKCIEYFYNKILLPINFIITKDSIGIISNIKYESKEKTSSKNVNNNLIDYLERIKQPIKNMIEDFPDFHDYEDEYDNILDIEEEAKTPEAIAEYFKSLSGLIKKEKIFKQFESEERENIIYEFENYILIQLYDKLFPFQETTQDNFFYRKCQRLSFLRPENIKGMKIKLEEDKWEKAVNALKEVDEKFSPIDKIECVANSLKILQDAINFTSGKSSLGVDNIIQPFVYAMIKACPKNIISNCNYCNLYLNEELQKKGLGASLSQFNLIVNIVKGMKLDELVGVTEEQFGKDEVEETTN